MDNVKSICNNCGNIGHLFYNCKKPITSFGIVCHRINETNQIEYLLIQRKDSLGYVDFLRGKYNENNNFQLKNIINEMTESEKENILNYKYNELWDKLWNKVNEKYDIKNEEKFNYIKTNKSFLFKTEQKWLEPEWGFPKGRRNYKEKDIDCAIREFEEETGYNKHDLLFIKNLNPFEEIFTGSNLKSYKHKYFLTYIQYKNSINNSNFQKSEIGDMNWFTYDVCLEKIRFYNIEKLNILKSINNLLQKYNIF
jgi:8-oxo-dGTP pyrophosphatase MutT (NUDIX family)